MLERVIRALQGLIMVFNSIGTPWIALFVIIIGMAFSVISKVYGLNGESAAGVIGAGIGLLTGQAIHGDKAVPSTPQFSLTPPPEPSK